MYTIQVTEHENEDYTKGVTMGSLIAKRNLDIEYQSERERNSVPTLFKLQSRYYCGMGVG